jgi:hypothetical protein
MKVTEENSRIQSRIRIRTKMSLIPNITIWADQYSDLVYERFTVLERKGQNVTGCEPLLAVYICAHGAKLNFDDLTPYV